MDSTDGYQEHPYGALTDNQLVYLRYHFAKWLCWNDAGLSPMDYVVPADELVKIVQDALYHHKEN